MGHIKAPQALIRSICWLSSQPDPTCQNGPDSIIWIWCGNLWRFTLADAFPSSRSITRSEFKKWRTNLGHSRACASSNGPGLIWADEDDLHLLRRTQKLRHGGPVARIGSSRQIKKINSLSHLNFHVESKSNLSFY
jgi:hypothetical protein